MGRTVARAETQRPTFLRVFSERRLHSLGIEDSRLAT